MNVDYKDFNTRQRRDHMAYLRVKQARLEEEAKALPKSSRARGQTNPQTSTPRARAMSTVEIVRRQQAMVRRGPVLPKRTTTLRRATPEEKAGGEYWLRRQTRAWGV